MHILSIFYNSGVYKMVVKVTGKFEKAYMSLTWSDLLDKGDLATAIQIVITSKLKYCKAFCVGLPLKLFGSSS